MNCDTYRIVYEGNVIASSMPLETALILLKALFLEYYNDTAIRYTLEKEQYAVAEGEQE